MGRTVKELGNTWEEVIDKVIKETKIKDSVQFRKWMREREKVGSKLFNSKMWVKCYNIWKKVHKENNDWFGVICGREGSGKSTLAIQIASVVDNDWNPSKLLYSPENLPELLRNAKKGDCLVLDEGNLFLFSREAMGGGNKLMVKLMALMRQLNIIVLVCIPNYFTIDSYLRDHRLHGVINIPKKRGRYMCYNDKYLKILSKEVAKYKDISKVRIPYDGWFDGWNSSLFPDCIDQEEYLRLKKEHFNRFLDEFDDALQAMCKPKASDWIDLPEVEKIIPLGRTKLISMAKNGELESKQFGKKWMMKREEVEKYMEDTIKSEEAQREKEKNHKQQMKNVGLPVVNGAKFSPELEFGEQGK